jgi:hypothetical protein
MGTWRWRRLFQFLRIAGALILLIFGWRPWRTSWLIVGTETLLLSFLAVGVDDGFPAILTSTRAVEAGLVPGSGPIDGTLRRRGGLRRPMGRRSGTRRDMEAICQARIASMFWRAATPRPGQAWQRVFRLPVGLPRNSRSAHADRSLP